MKPIPSHQLPKTEEEWAEQLTPEQFRILRLKGTERAYTGIYDQHFEEGVYVCAGCQTPLFQSDTKFASHCGWPSFFASLGEDVVRMERDTSHGMVRTEILCAHCGGHLGHIFPDGPAPTGMRYCVNSASLKFKSE